MGIPSKQALAALGCLAVAIGLAGCGETVSSSSFSGESKAVATRISEFQQHATEANEGKICSQDLGAHLRAELAKAGKEAATGCKEALKQQLKLIEDVNLSVTAVAVHGSSATATVKSTWSGKNCSSTLQLERPTPATKSKASPWKISGMQSSCT